MSINSVGIYNSPYSKVSFGNNPAQNNLPMKDNSNLQQTSQNKVDVTSKQEKNNKVALYSAIGAVAALAILGFAFRGKFKASSNTKSEIKVGTEEIKADLDKFYLGSIKPLFEKYNVGLTKDAPIGTLSVRIGRKVKIDGLESLVKQESVDALLNEYQSFIKKSLDIPYVKDVKDGPFVSKNLLIEIIYDCGYISENALSSTPEQNAKLILKSSFEEGKNAIIKNFGKRFEELDSLNKNKDASLQEYFKTLKHDLDFHLKLYKTSDLPSP